MGIKSEQQSLIAAHSKIKAKKSSLELVASLRKVGKKAAVVIAVIATIINLKIDPTAKKN